MATHAADMDAHDHAEDGGRAICSCGDVNCASLDYTACSFALAGGRYCKGDVRFPATHATACPQKHAEKPRRRVIGSDGASRPEKGQP